MMAKRRIVAAAAAACFFLATAMWNPGLAAAAPTDYQILAGDFVGDSRDELFYYAPGTAPDYLTGFSFDGLYYYLDVLGEFTVNGSYKPLVGDFDGDGYDEILWYAPGTTTDYMWNFTGNTTVSSVPYTVNGNYARPTVGDYTGDGVDDVLWYAPGSGPDYLWDYNVGGSYVSVPRTINGVYLPVSGSFGNDATDDIFWYSPGTAPDYLWDYVPGTTQYTQQKYAVNGTNYRPVAVDMFGDGPGNEDILWYAPGPTADFTWDFYLGTRTSYPESISGDYLVAAGDFLGDGIEDVVFDTYDRTILWDHGPGVRTVVTWVWDTTLTASSNETGRAASPDREESGRVATAIEQEPLAVRR
ncbi:MAG TPA: VCBS repeat-containing protein [Nocardioidaceae bacterium]|nr:VCBS repeat-containing protein [Nocardioidaceae bacterium]